MRSDIASCENNKCMEQSRNMDFEESSPFNPFRFNKKAPPPLFIKGWGSSPNSSAPYQSNSQELGFGQPCDGSRPRPQHHHPRWPLPPAVRVVMIGPRKWDSHQNYTSGGPPTPIIGLGCYYLGLQVGNLQQ